MGEVLCRWDPHNVPILSEFAGRIRFEDLIEGKTLKTERDARKGVVRRQVVEHKGDLHPQIVLEDKAGQPLALYPIPERAYVEVEDGAMIGAGELLAKSAREAAARRTSPAASRASPSSSKRGGRRTPPSCRRSKASSSSARRSAASARSSSGAQGQKGEVIQEQQHAVPQGKHLRVHKGDEVRAGEPLVDGPLDPHDILRIRGEEEVLGYLLREIQNVYRSQSVTIDDKHIEIVLAQMMRKVQVSDPGDSEFLRAPSSTSSGSAARTTASRRRRRRPPTARRCSSA
jgi:DNA-directed RNA polymerase subunit beta'